eukprot:1108384-Rhodomonas_salina.1
MWEQSRKQYRKDFLARRNLSQFERGPRAYPDCQHGYEHSPLYAADKVWAFNNQAYTGPIAGPHAEGVLSAIYGMDFTELFETTKILHTLFAQFPNMPAQNNAQMDEIIVAFLQETSFFTKFFNETLSQKNTQKFIQFVNDLYWNAVTYYENTPEEDQFASQNPFQRFANVQPLYIPKFGYYMPEIYKHFFEPLAQKMDSIVQDTKTLLLAKNPTITPRTLLQEIVAKLDAYLETKDREGTNFKKL